MADEEREFRLKITAVTTQAETGFSELQKKIITANEGLHLFREALTIAGEAFEKFHQFIERGKNFGDIENSFKNLSNSIGIVSSDFLPQLQEATQGTISKFDLMKEANQALQAGLKPDEFIAVAKAANVLGAQIGENAVVEFDKLTQAVITGNDRLLKREGVLLNNAEVEEKYAKSIGLVATATKSAGDQLNEDGKRFANRQAIIEALIDKQKLLGEGSVNLGEQFEIVTAKFTNFRDEIAKYINNAPELIKVTTDFSRGLSILGEELVHAQAGLETFLNASVQGQANNLALSIENLRQRRQELEDASKRKIRIEYDDGSILTGDAISKRLEEVKGKLAESENLFKGYLKVLGGDAEAQKKSAEEAKRHAEALDKLKNGHVDLIGKQKDAQSAMDKLTEASKKQKEEFDQLTASLKVDELKSSLDYLLSDYPKTFNQIQFDDFFNQYKEEYKKAILETETVKRAEALKNGQLTIDDLNDYAVRKTELATIEIARKQEQEQKNAFTNSFNLFTDLLSSADQYADFEDTLKDVMKRVAIGFVAQALASWTATNFGLNLGGITSAGGLGASIASSFGFGGGGVASLSSLANSIGGASSIYNGVNSTFGTVAAGPPTASGIYPVAAGSTNFGSYILPGAGIALGAYGLSQSLGNGKQDILSGAASGAAVGAGIGTFILPGVGTAVGAGIGAVGGGLAEYFDADTKKAKERKAREEALDRIYQGNLSFQGVGGLKTLSASNFNLDPSGLGSQAGALASPLASVLSGGDGKLKDDLTAIFANATKEGSNFNEVLVNTQALMEKTGYSAQQAKDELTQLFLDGEVGLTEFSSGIENLNLLAQDNLVGKGSVSDAIGIITSNLSSPRVQIKGIALAFSEMAELGLTSFEQIHSYLSSTASPEIVKAFDTIEQAGFNSFETVAQAGADGIITIANAFKDVLPSLQSDFIETSNVLASSTNNAVNDATKDINRLRASAERDGSAIRNALNIKANIEITRHDTTDQSLNKAGA